MNQEKTDLGGTQEGDGVSEIRSSRLNSECSILFTQNKIRLLEYIQVLFVT